MSGCVLISDSMACDQGEGKERRWREGERELWRWIPQFSELQRI